MSGDARGPRSSGRAEGGRRVGGGPAPPVPLPGMRGAPGTWRRREAGGGRSGLTGRREPASRPPGEWRQRRFPLPAVAGRGREERREKGR